MKVAKLVCITSMNNNKYYNMIEQGNTIQVEYGRVGSSKCIANYPASRWSSLYNSKIKKGYKDITELTENKTNITVFKTIDNKNLQEFFDKIISFSKTTVSNNYNVSSDSVSKKQLSVAQDILNELSSISPRNKTFNEKLLELYSIIPRKMDHVSNYLIKDDLRYSDIIIAREQQLLDSLKTQVKTTIEHKEDKDILETLGIKAEEINDKDSLKIFKLLGDLKSKFKCAYKITHLERQEKFSNFIDEAEEKKTMLLWHGSRNENWLNILNTGLLIRPTNVVLTGSMFGYGIYAADKAQKSFGYTSAKGSFWARGNQNTAYMGIFKFHIGKPYVVKYHANWMCSLTENKLKQKGNYDSVFSLGGYDLRNNEYIVYNENQCSIEYIVELTA